jgi:hypothetical protein
MNKLNEYLFYKRLIEDTSNHRIKIYPRVTTSGFLTNLLIVCYFIVLFSSCNSDDFINEKVVDIKPPIQVVKISDFKSRSSNNEHPSEDEFVLLFRDEEVFKETINELTGMSLDERLEWTEELTDFNSIAQIYEQAMAEAENYYDRQGGYEEFKDKYSNLYFPEEGDDYGAYLPYKDDIEAFCANENGRLMIGEEIIDIEPLTTYEELIESGRAPIEVEPSGFFEIEVLDSLIANAEMSIRSAPSELLRVDAVLMTPPNVFQKNVIGDALWKNSTGWRRYGDRKIIINLTRETRMNRWLAILPEGFRLEWHLDVAFRKKGFLGVWYNYRNNSDVTVTFRYRDSNGIPTSQRQFMRNVISGASSSHDMFTKANVIRYITPSIYEDWNNVYDYYTHDKIYPRCVYEMPGYWADVSAYIGGVPYQRFVFIAPVLYGYTNYASDKLE